MFGPIILYNVFTNDDKGRGKKKCYFTFEAVPWAAAAPLRLSSTHIIMWLRQFCPATLTVPPGYLPWLEKSFFEKLVGTIICVIIELTIFLPCCYQIEQRYFKKKKRFMVQIPTEPCDPFDLGLFQELQEYTLSCVCVLVFLILGFFHKEYWRGQKCLGFLNREVGTKILVRTRISFMTGAVEAIN